MSAEHTLRAVALYLRRYERDEAYTAEQALADIREAVKP